MSSIHPQDPAFLFERSLHESIDMEQQYENEDLGPTDCLPLEMLDLKSEWFYGSSFTSSAASSSPSRSASPGPAVSSSQAPIRPTKKPQNSRTRRNKKKSREKRNRERQAKRNARRSRTYESEIFAKYVAPANPSRTSFDTAQFPTAATGYICLPGEGGGVYGLRELIEGMGFTLEAWDGRSSRPITDASSRIIAVLAGKPDDPCWEEVHRDAAEAIDTSRSWCRFPKKATRHCRGNFPALSWGISHGGGQKQPGNLVQNTQNTRVLKALTADRNISRIAGFASGAFATWAPKLYQYYEKNIEDLLHHDSSLTRNWPNSVWASFAVNFGPRTICRRHRDFANLPFGWCAITALGNFDPTMGGHLVLWSLKLVVEFPPGSTILIPSSAIAHSNVPIASDETRYSFTQYSAGGLFRWAEQGFQCTDDYMAELTPEGKDEDERKQSERCKLGLSLFSTTSSICADQLNLTRPL